MAGTTKELNFCFHFILINLNVNGHMWPGAAALFQFQHCFTVSALKHEGLYPKIVGGHMKGLTKG